MKRDSLAPDKADVGHRIDDRSAPRRPKRVTAGNPSSRTPAKQSNFEASRSSPIPIEEADLERYLVDQDSPIGLLTRVAPAVELEKTPAFVDHAGSFPGSSTLDIGWSPGPLVPHAVPHRPTAIFRLRRAHWRGRQVL